MRLITIVMIFILGISCSSGISIRSFKQIKKAGKIKNKIIFKMDKKVKKSFGEDYYIFNKTLKESFFKNEISFLINYVDSEASILVDSLLNFDDQFIKDQNIHREILDDSKESFVLLMTVLDYEEIRLWGYNNPATSFSTFSGGSAVQYPYLLKLTLFEKSTQRIIWHCNLNKGYALAGSRKSNLIKMADMIIKSLKEDGFL